MRLRRLDLVIAVLIFANDGFAQLTSISLGNSGNACGGLPHSLTFSISSNSGNAPNTTYHLNFGGGSPVINYTQATIPTTVCNAYSSVSFGQVYFGIPKSYRATLSVFKK